MLSLGNEAGGGALEGGGDWLKSGGVSVRDLAGSSPTEDKKTQSKEHQHQRGIKYGDGFRRTALVVCIKRQVCIFANIF